DHQADAQGQAERDENGLTHPPAQLTAEVGEKHGNSSGNARRGPSARGLVQTRRGSGARRSPAPRQILTAIPYKILKEFCGITRIPGTKWSRPGACPGAGAPPLRTLE